MSELQKVTKGDFENLLTAMLTPLNEYLAKELRKSVKGVGTDEDTLIDILCVFEEENIMYVFTNYDIHFAIFLHKNVD